ncbi:hypothetical protein BO78DRAFT_425728 [Aspergillus sclerotiicarbonarius CBS 121057]|uniref:SUN domain protein n=1 Tax=Aspergillus sclerotiicarbonarius (strain CBS 121057 / IBT 28362) TaxID=1448318 RepID=A0A319ERF3_ASPSB|nr:hypothetical protein BO78DRAFT_425728 [Aspergillus sclerotiicarbonarius CBS 121057]
MKSSSATLALLAIAAVEAASHGHDHDHSHAHRSVAEVDAPVAKRGGSCQFPSGAGLIAVTPGELNGGWAMSPNQECKPGGYCPYACPAGQVSMQWDPEATSYTYPLSMNGGLYCDENGKMQKPFPDRPYCQDGTGVVSAKNKCKEHISFCQTVLPGNEAMLIPTLVEELVTLAVPDLSYWCETAAHFYINPPGYTTETACVWGSSENPYGNWSPYVAGANTDGEGNTFVKIGWNPIYLELTTPFRNVIPDYGVEIECEGDGCNGLPCKIDPAVNGVNEMIGANTDGAGGAAFCVVTVPKGGKANIVVFDKEGDSSSVPVSSSSSTVSSSVSSVVSTSSTSTSSIIPTTSSTSTSISTISTTSTPTPSSTSTSTSTSSTTTSTTSSTISTTSTTSSILITPRPTPSWTPSSSWKLSSTSAALNRTASASYSYKPLAMVETGSSHATAASKDSSDDSNEESSDDKSDSSSNTKAAVAVTQGAAVTTAVSKLGLILAVIGAVVMV